MSDLTFTFSGDASSLKAALEDIKSSVNSTKNSVGSLATTVTAAFAAATTAIAGSFLAINAAAERETLTTAFIPLLGSVQAAKERMGELAQFAASTPFQINEIAAASKTLQSLTNGALATGDGLRLVGDVASSTNTAFSEIAVTIGRLYAGLDSGRPVGEALARLQELGAISPDVRSKLEDLQKAGKKGSEVWQIAANDLNRFSNSMELQSATWSGKVSTMGDAWEELLVRIGQPFIVALTPALEALTSTFEALADTGAQFGAQMGSILSAVGGAFTLVLDTITPLIIGLTELSSMLGGAHNMLIIVASAWLTFGKNTAIADAALARVRLGIASTRSAMSSMSFATITTSIKSSLTSAVAYVRSSAISMRTIWSSTMTAMATVTRVSMLTIKAALASTGIGLILVGISEALSALYLWWAGNEEAAKQASEAAAQYAKTIKSIESQSAKVKTFDELENFINNLDSSIEQLEEKLSFAEADDNEELTEELQRQVNALRDKKKHYEEILPLQVESALRAEREAAALAKKREEEKKLAEEMQQAADKLKKLEEDYRKANRDAYLSSLPNAELEIKLRLSDSGLGSLEALEKEMAELSNNSKYSISQSQLSRYEELLTLHRSIKGIMKEQTEEQRKQAQEATKAKADYEHQVALLQAEIAGNDTKIKQLQEEQRIIELTAEYRKQGFAQALEMAQKLVALESQAEEARAKREQEKRDAEKKDDNAREADRQSGQFIQSSQAGVGGGGRSILIGGPLLNESKKQSNLLTQVRDAVREKPIIKVEGNVTAIIGS